MAKVKNYGTKSNGKNNVGRKSEKIDPKDADQSGEIEGVENLSETETEHTRQRLYEEAVSEIESEFEEAKKDYLKDGESEDEIEELAIARLWSDHGITPPYYNSLERNIEKVVLKVAFEKSQKH